MAKSYERLVIGGGVSGLIYAALSSSENKILILDTPSKKNLVGKRILVSGNGRCNFFNEALLHEETFDEPLFGSIKEIVYHKNNLLSVELLEYLRSNGFSFYKEGDLYYPFFNRAESFHSFLLSRLKDNVSFLFAKALKVNRKDKTVLIEKDGQQETISYQKLIFAPGGFSYDREEDYSLLDSLDVSYRKFSPCLCPIKVKEKIPSFMDGKRLRGVLTLSADGKRVKSEDGELLFKKDGISGILVFNHSLIVNELIKEGVKDISFEFDFTTYKNQKINPLDDGTDYPDYLIKYLEFNNLTPHGVLRFTFDKLYPFNQSQISYGGILLDQINPDDMTLKQDKDVVIIGEVLDQAFPCGGYNIGMALIEGYKAGLYGE